MLNLIGINRIVLFLFLPKFISSHTTTTTTAKVRYTIEDPDVPAPAHLLELVQKEEAFAQQYRQSTGLEWRHFYGQNGPRPPPILNMWPADEIGQVHTVQSDHGQWCVFTALTLPLVV